MLDDVESFAEESGLHLIAQPGRGWAYVEDHPHIVSFNYDVAIWDEDGDDLRTVGTADGYRITHDWTVEADQMLWEEADALDADVVTYVEALIREVRACGAVFDSAPDLSSAQRILILRHVEPSSSDLSGAELIRGVAACLAMMDAPVFMLVDPWPMSSDRKPAKGKLEGRAHVAKLLELGLVRMVGSRFLWGWNREMSDSLMAEYSYEELLAAKRAGSLAKVLKAPVANEVYGELPAHVAEMLGVPDPDEIDRE